MKSSASWLSRSTTQQGLELWLIIIGRDAGPNENNPLVTIHTSFWNFTTLFIMTKITECYKILKIEDANPIQTLQLPMRWVKASSLHSISLFPQYPSLFSIVQHQQPSAHHSRKDVTLEDLRGASLMFLPVLSIPSSYTFNPRQWLILQICLMGLCLWDLTVKY